MCSMKSGLLTSLTRALRRLQTQAKDKLYPPKHGTVFDSDRIRDLMLMALFDTVGSTVNSMEITNKYYRC